MIIVDSPLREVPYKSLSYSPVNNQFASVQSDRKGVILQDSCGMNASDAKMIADRDRSASLCALSPNGDILAVAYEGGLVEVFHTNQISKPFFYFDFISYVYQNIKKDRSVISMRITPDNKFLFLGFWNGVVVLHLDKCVLAEQFETGGAVRVMKFIPNRPCECVIGGDCQTRIIAFNDSGQKNIGVIPTLPIHNIYAIDITDDGSEILLGGKDRGVHVYSINPLEEKQIIYGHHDDVDAVSFLHLGKDDYIVSASKGDSVIRFNRYDRQEKMATRLTFELFVKGVTLYSSSSITVVPQSIYLFPIKNHTVLLSNIVYVAHSEGFPL